MVAEDIRFVIPRNLNTDVLKDIWHSDIMALVRSSDILKRVWVQYPVKAVDNFQRGN